MKTIRNPVTMAVLLAALLLAGCSILPKATPLRTFTLPTATAQSEATSAPGASSVLPVTLRVDTPNATPLLNGVRMLVQPDNEEIRIYAGTRWQDTPPALLQERLISALRRDGRIRAIISNNSPANNDVILSSTLTGFYSRYDSSHPDSAPVAIIEINAQLIDSGKNHVMATRHFSVRHTATDEQIESVVRAFGQAAEQFERQVVDWTVTQLQHHGQQP